MKKSYIKCDKNGDQSCFGHLSHAIVVALISKPLYLSVQNIHFFLCTVLSDDWTGALMEGERMISWNNAT